MLPKMFSVFNLSSAFSSDMSSYRPLRHAKVEFSCFFSPAAITHYADQRKGHRMHRVTYRISKVFRVWYLGPPSAGDCTPVTGAPATKPPPPVILVRVQVSHIWYGADALKSSGLRPKKDLEYTIWQPVGEKLQVWGEIRPHSPPQKKCLE